MRPEASDITKPYFTEVDLDHTIEYLSADSRPEAAVRRPGRLTSNDNTPMQVEPLDEIVVVG
jgi:hypothetical protein